MESSIFDAIGIDPGIILIFVLGVLLIVLVYMIKISMKMSRFIKKYGLVSPSSVSSAVKSLLDKDFITNDKGAYSVYDKFFLLWLSRQNLLVP